MKKFKLIQLNGDVCAGCAQNLPVVRQVLANRDDCDFVEIGELEEIAKIVRRYGLTHLPALVLLGNDEFIGEVHGYQPEEILAVWLDAKIEQFNLQGERA